MNKQIKTHTCPSCGFIDECDIVIVAPQEPVHHSCRECNCVWRDDGVVVAGSGEPE